MPELPEVETIVRFLRPGLVGKSINKLELLHPRVARRSNPEFICESVKNATIVDLTRRGKFIQIKLDQDRPDLIVHLRMTGQLLVSKEKIDSPHLRALFHLNDGTFLNFVDIRTFGLIFSLGEEIPKGFSELGPEPLTDKFSVKYFAEIIAGRNTPIKTFLLRQDMIAGIGNIYASEACFMAGIHPATPAGEVPKDKIPILHKKIRKVLRQAISEMGTTFSNYRRPDGETGNFANKLLVYGRSGEACHTCGEKIERIVQNGRSTFFCPHCQHTTFSG